MVHTALWWADGVLYTDNARWLDLIHTQARKTGEQITEETAPDGPPAGHLADQHAGAAPAAPPA